MIDRRLAAMLLAVTLASCASSYGPPVLQTPPPARLDASYWTAVDEALARRSVGNVVAGESSRAWELPYLGIERRSEVAPPGDRVESTVTSAVNLGIHYFPVLPLWASRDVYVAERGRDTVVTSAIDWSLLWTSSESSPDAERRLETAGVPLLYWTLGDTTDSSSSRWHQFLWTVGPGFGWGHDDASGEGYWFALPVAAGGLGGALWMSLERWSPDEEVGGHGPFAALWFHLRERDPTGLAMRLAGAESLSLDAARLNVLALGALWTDIEGYDADGRVVSARHGPLWSGLGWGRDEGEPVLWLFGLAIRL